MPDPKLRAATLLRFCDPPTPPTTHAVDRRPPAGFEQRPPAGCDSATLLQLLTDAWLPASRQPAGRPDCPTDWTLRAVFVLTRWTLPASEPGFGFLSEFWV
jgi:hypothetical protein